MDRLGLGQYREFQAWSGQPRTWGPDGKWRATFGGGVVDNLAAGIRSFRSECSQRWPTKAEATPVAVGCVPWFTSVDVSDALVSLGGSVLVVVDKGHRRSAAISRLLDSDAGFWQQLLPGLDTMGPLDADGQRPVVHPSAPLPGDREIGPVRVAGWKGDGDGIPLVHMKLLVLAGSWHWDVEGVDVEHLTPLKVWFGSANWTVASSSHLEFGAWCDDEAICREAWSFCADLVRFSEPYKSGTAGPEPDLVEGAWDEIAFAEYAAERAFDEPDDD